MNDATENHTQNGQDGAAASIPAKRPWHTPEFDEVDLAETQFGSSHLNPADFGSSYS